MLTSSTGGAGDQASGGGNAVGGNGVGGNGRCGNRTDAESRGGAGCTYADHKAAHVQSDCCAVPALPPLSVRFIRKRRWCRLHSAVDARRGRDRHRPFRSIGLDSEPELAGPANGFGQREESGGDFLCM